MSIKLYGENPFLSLHHNVIWKKSQIIDDGFLFIKSMLMQEEIMGKNYKAMRSPELSTNWEARYVVVDTDTGEILDNAQGYGYRTAQKAYAAYGYKTRDKAKDEQKRKKRKLVKEWCKSHKDIVRCLEDDEFCIAKGSYGPDDKFNAKWVKDSFEAYGVHDLPFTAGEFLRYWKE